MEKKRERLWTRDYIIIMIAAAGTSFCNYFFFTGMPLYAEKLTGTSIYAGLVTSVYSLAALIIRPVAGVLSDKIGRVKILIIGAAICTVACLGYNIRGGAAAAAALLLVFRALNGVGFGMHSTCAGAAVADVIPPARMTEGVGFFGLYATVAQAFAPMIALAIIGGESMGEYRNLFFVSAALCAVSFVCDMNIKYERKKKSSGDLPREEASVPKKPEALPPDKLPKTFLGFEYAVFLPMAVVLLAQIGLSSVSGFLSLYAKDVGIEGVGMFFTVSAVGVFAARFLFGRIVDKKGADVVVIPALVAIALSVVAVGFSKTLPALLITAVPYGLANGAFGPTMNTMMFKRCSPQRRGTASAAFFAALDVGFTIGPAVLGFIADLSGYAAIYRASGVFILLAFVVYTFFASDRAVRARAARKAH